MGRRVSVAELVGRGDELAVLDAALSDTTAGAGRLVLVEGDAGVGKSRLVQAFTSRATAGGATVLAGGCLQLEADIPYAPFTEALRAIPNPPLVGSGGAGNRSDEFRRVAETIADAGSGAPVVLVIEDLHWADASTRDLLVFLHRACTTPRCCRSALGGWTRPRPTIRWRRWWPSWPARPVPNGFRCGRWTGPRC